MSAVPFNNEASFRSFEHLRISVDPDLALAWMQMDPRPRPCFTPQLLDEIRQYQQTLIRHGGRLPYDSDLVPVDYQVLASRDPAVFNLGGDLERFVACIESGNAEWLRQYGYACIEAAFPNINGYDLSITTISLVRGEAMGGGFEAALSSQVLIAERDAQMGLPEVLFNLFPGMGAYQLLGQRIGPAGAERMILSGRVYSAEELYGMGVVDVLAEPGEGVAALHAYVRAHRRRRNAHLAVNRVRRQCSPVSREELLRVCDIWVDAALSLGERDLRTMQRLLRSQNRLAAPVREVLPHPLAIAEAG